MATSQGLVNWKIVDAELDRIPQEFMDPKFYALKHVVDILTSSNPQGMVAQVISSATQLQLGQDAAAGRRRRSGSAGVLINIISINLCCLLAAA